MGHRCPGGTRFFGVGGTRRTFLGTVEIIYSIGLGAFPNPAGVVSAVQSAGFRCHR